jgi:anaerobic magnesium-protoporphyrin IX monomethyl ester cyclase
MNSTNSMNILLINPGWGGRISRKGRRFNRAWPPLSLMICASLLEKEGFHVQIIDGRVDHDWKERTARLARESDWIGLTSSPLDRWQCPNLEVDTFIELARSLPSDKLLIMGAHGSLFPGQMLQQTGARAVIIGEPEETLHALLTHDQWHEITGVVFRKDGEIVHTGAPLPANLGELPMPAFHLLNPSKYFYELMGRPFALFEASRGCPYECTFCLKTMYGRGVRFKPIDHLMVEIEQAVTSFGFRCGYLIDLEFTTNRERVMEICHQLIIRNSLLLWCCQTRADAVDVALLERMKQAGCRLIHFGVESGSPRILKDIKKRINRDTIKKGVRLAQEVGIDTACFFMLGFPGESPADMEETLTFAKELNPTYASFHTVTPYPGTAIGTMTSSPDSTDGVMGFPAYCEAHDPLFLDRTIRKAYFSYYLRAPYMVSRLRYGNLHSLLRQIMLFAGFTR